ncbi:MAG: HAMP domain-containing protein, partial [Chloroflexi bacterium]|nr:HAMP domain-containing protein [Chloroflexota bacterium]
MTLRTRLAIWFAGLVALLIALFSAMVIALMWWSMVRDVDAKLQDTADLINANSRFAILPVTQQTRFQVDLPELDFVRASGTEVQVWIKDGDSFTPVDASANLQDYPNALDETTLGTQHAHAFSTVNIDKTWWRVHTNPIWYGEEIIGSIQVAQSLEVMYVATRSLLFVVLGCSVIAIGGAIILSRWLARRLLEPVQDLTSAASRIAGASDLSTRLTWSGPNDELGRLIGVFNRMMERLQNVFNVQQRFVADISHELRTPLTGILGHVELMRRYGVDEESLNAIHSDTARMSRLIHDLLMLARSDYGGTPVNLMPLDADGIVMSAAKS